MGIDASVIAGLRAPQIQQAPDPFDQYGKSLALRGLMQKGELQGMQMDEARRGLADEEALRSAYRQSGGDSAQLRALLQQGGQYKQIQALDKFDLERRGKEATIGKDESAGAKSKFDVHIGRLERGAALFAGATDQASYDNALRVGQLTETFSPEAIAKFPKEFNPQFVASMQNAGLTQAQKLADQRARETQAGLAANQPFTAGPDGPVPNQPVQDFLLAKGKASAPSVSVRLDNKTGESLAKPIGEMVQGSKDIAMSSIDQIETANRIRAALDSGQVMAGPGTTLKLSADRVAQVLGVGGKDSSERLQNTRQVIKGLADFTLGARKQLKGQGQVSDFEGKLIEKASSGDIDSLTVPEIRSLVDVTDRLARKAYGLHGRNIEALKGNPEYAGLLPFYSVPDLPPPPKAKDPAPKAGAPKTAPVKFLGYED